MELNLTEEKCQRIWSIGGPVNEAVVCSGKERFLSLIRGCDHVVTELQPVSGKHLALHPLRVIFPDWIIGIQPNMTTELAVIVDICPRIKEE